MASTETNRDQDVITMLLAQHEQAKALFARLDTAQGAQIEEPFCELRRLLAVHETAEEEVVYPVVKLAGDRGPTVARARLDEEDKAKKVLSELESMELTGTDFREKLLHFKNMVLAHAEHEESEVFPLLRQHESAERLDQMGSALRVAEAAAPTHPHPHGPQSAVGNLVIGPAVAIMDRVRDALKKAS
jgi:hemerythrin superfamily protein